MYYNVIHVAATLNDNNSTPSSAETVGTWHDAATDMTLEIGMFLTTIKGDTGNN